jgi:hypothetical protein
MHNEAATLETDLQKIIDEKLKINRGYVAGLICLVVTGIILIIVLGLSFIGAFIAIFFVCCVIHVIRKVWRYLLSLRTRSKEQQFEIRLSSLNLYLKSLKKSSLSLTEFESILEKVFQEFLPAIILRIHNPKLSKELQDMIKYLKSDSVHSSMLNSTIHLELSIHHKRNQVLTAARLRTFFIPVMHLLKQPPGEEGKELEIVRRISDLLSMEQTQVLLLTFKLNHDKFLKTLFPFWVLAEHFQETLQFSRFLFEVDTICNPSRTQFTQKLLMYRRNSFDDKDIRHSKSRNLKRLKIVQQSIETFTATACFDDESVMDTSVRSLQKPVLVKLEREAIFEDDSEKVVLVPKNIPALFHQQNIVDLEGSGSDNEEVKQATDDEVFEPQTVKIIINDNNSNRQDGDSDSMEIIPECVPNKVVHPYMDCFEQLLAIEREPNNEKTWRLVVNKPETKCYQRKAENSPICMIKAFCDVNYSAKTVYTAIWNTDIRRQWDAVFNEFRLIDTQPFYEVLYYMIKTPFGITKRDWLQRRIEIHDFPEPNTIILHFISMEHPLMPPKKGIIRAETLISGYIIRPTGENTCKVMIVSQNDIKGLIPKAIVNSVASKAPADWVNSMNKGCKIVSSLI